MEFPVLLPTDTLILAAKLGVFPEDIEEKFVRGSGAGGQKINKTSSCVWLRHVPTKTEVKCQKHREREKNRISAYKLLVKKIEAIKLGKESSRAKKIFKLKKQKQRRSRRAQEKVLEGKARRGEIKSLRKPVGL
ncbi:peptide chain release factor-like protein [Candidatus Peregrinibacteria bacterium CG22_combo_CG10-13_8_21_14_all_44_10]|nr:MAG: hypothetical protein AUK45_00105 [Candidatus Peregrinibacteria bacterium CG2_30_44_17]PIP66667.1 MAG: peptide chain release factor-like protein [Candidatus Peregrinibacteria bacterium CG22_combo_CG10-13_8_21_14_all_44_10]PIS04131.1 MAG: peptide chain release factor-like protein [Candidatus Peregrinibacteria bacterium CG10_big_fil_rev_8_21_14_0_10_44_7]PIX80537.1 MAG: peptide chain release factor-like protein [Candidatus Peregrinibacteria bacterium CG_4_10_14_3_um_filter_44_21]PJB88512.1